MAFSVPSLAKICISKIVKEIKNFCYGVRFEDLAKFKYIVGPFENISSQCIEAIFEHVISTKQLNSSWLSLLIVPHLRAIDFTLFPGGVTPQLFRILINRCQILERIIIPNCKKIPNKTICDLLSQNPALLKLDLSNKAGPKVDASVVNALARSCRYLTVLKLSSFIVSDPRTLLVLCGKTIVQEQRSTHHDGKVMASSGQWSHGTKPSSIDATKEECEDQRAVVSDELSGVDVLEKVVLNVEDCSAYGCFDLETLWLDNINIVDQVMTVLLKCLPKLRDLNLSNTNISNPWLLLDPARCPHLLELEELDIKYTALSKTALELIPKFHPNLHRLSLSCTSLPPHTYAVIGRLTGVTDLEMIGKPYYVVEPQERFDKSIASASHYFDEGVALAIHSIGMNLRFLSLTYFVPVEFEVIPKYCPRLEHLDLRFTTILVQCPCKSLGECCPLLRNLNLMFCNIEATDVRVSPPQPVSHSNALQNIIGQPYNLTELYLSGLAVGDDILKNIFPKEFHPLQRLDLSRCSLVTINAVECVWERCPFLRIIDLTLCEEITVNDWTWFKQCCEERPIFQKEGKLIWE